MQYTVDGEAYQAGSACSMLARVCWLGANLAVGQPQKYKRELGFQKQSNALSASTLKSNFLSQTLKYVDLFHLLRVNVIG